MNSRRLPTGVFTPTTRRYCRQLVANSCTHRRRDATRQFRLVGVGGVYWALHCVAGENKDVFEGQSVRLQCRAVLSNDVRWHYTSPRDNDIKVVYWKNHTSKDRFHIDRPEQGVFNLVISEVTASDAGTYQCHENTGEHPGETCTQIIVKGEQNRLYE